MTLKETMLQNRQAQFQEVKKKICDAFLKAQQESVWKTTFRRELVWTKQKTLEFCSAKEESESVTIIEEPIAEKECRKEIIDWLKKELTEEGIDAYTREDRERELQGGGVIDASNGDIENGSAAILEIKMS